ncbi:MAG: hypothetical protein U0931_32995 [Vulcanimicrobiota bacterium]
MKRLFAILLLTLPGGAEPIVSGEWTIEARPLDEQRAQVEACYQEANQEDNYWRARLDEQKLGMELHHELLGPLQADLDLEESWQSELDQRRAQVTLSLVDLHGWTSGLSSRWEDQGQQWSTPQLRGWVVTPQWRGWSARGEVTGDGDHHGYLARVCKRLGRGQLQLETAVTESEHLQRRWLARYQWRLNQTASFSTSGSRTFYPAEGEVQDKVEANLEVHF